jgi:cytochrome c6
MNVLLMLALSAQVSAAPAAPAAAANPGQAIFAKKCVACHGKDGKGNAKMATMLKAKPEDVDLSGDAHQKKSDADLLKVLSDGKNKMPAFKGKLKDAEMKDVLAFVRSLAAAAAPAGAK